MGVVRGASIRGAVLIASWRFGWTLLVWLFIFIIIALLFKCLKSFLQTLGEAIEQLFDSSDRNSSSASGARGRQQAVASANQRRNRRWIQSRGVAASVAAETQENSVGGGPSSQAVAGPPSYSAEGAPPTGTFSNSTTTLPHTPDLPPQYDQLSIQDNNRLDSAERGIRSGSLESGTLPPAYSSLFPEADEQSNKK